MRAGIEAPSAAPVTVIQWYALSGAPEPKARALSAELHPKAAIRAGLANLATALLDFVPAVTTIATSRLTIRRSRPTAIAVPSRVGHPVTMLIPWARWVRLRPRRTLMTVPRPAAGPYCLATRVAAEVLRARRVAGLAWGRATMFVVVFMSVSTLWAVRVNQVTSRYIDAPGWDVNKKISQY